MFQRPRLKSKLKMPEGPLGFPRLTNVGPLTKQQRVAEWVVNAELGHAIWTSVTDSAHLRFNKDVALHIQFKEQGDIKHLVRLAEDSYSDPQTWVSPFSIMDPAGFGMETTFRVNMTNRDGNPSPRVSLVNLSTIPVTSNGAIMPCEFEQPRLEPATATLRVPIPEEMSDEVTNHFREEYDATILYEGVEAFQSRFTEVGAETGPQSYQEPHIQKEGVTDTPLLIEMWRDAVEFAERGVRMA